MPCDRRCLLLRSSARRPWCQVAGDRPSRSAPRRDRSRAAGLPAPLRSSARGPWCQVACSGPLAATRHPGSRSRRPKAPFPRVRTHQVPVRPSHRTHLLRLLPASWSVPPGASCPVFVPLRAAWRGTRCGPADQPGQALFRHPQGCPRTFSVLPRFTVQVHSFMHSPSTERVRQTGWHVRPSHHRDHRRRRRRPPQPPRQDERARRRDVRRASPPPAISSRPIRGPARRPLRARVGASAPGSTSARSWPAGATTAASVRPARRTRAGAHRQPRPAGRLHVDRDAGPGDRGGARRRPRRRPPDRARRRHPHRRPRRQALGDRDPLGPPPRHDRPPDAAPPRRARRGQGAGLHGPHGVGHRGQRARASPPAWPTTPRAEALALAAEIAGKNPAAVRPARRCSTRRRPGRSPRRSARSAPDEGS